MFSTYVRLKVLTESGKKYANVELGYASSNDNGSISVDDIEGRTIHPDGTIIPFTGKPYEKLIEKTRARSIWPRSSPCPTSRSAASSSTATTGV